MKRTTWAALALAGLAAACSSNKEATREDETAQAEEARPQEGVIASVDSGKLMLDNVRASGEEPDLFERTDGSMVVRDGEELRWTELAEGDAVRVHYEPGIFGPNRIERVEVLTGEEAEAVRREARGDLPPPPAVGEPGEPPPPPATGTPPPAEPTQPTPY